jgi:hypothetical protein
MSVVSRRLGYPNTSTNYRYPSHRTAILASLAARPHCLRTPLTAQFRKFHIALGLANQRKGSAWGYDDPYVGFLGNITHPMMRTPLTAQFRKFVPVETYPIIG